MILYRLISPLSKRLRMYNEKAHFDYLPYFCKSIVTFHSRQIIRQLNMYSKMLNYFFVKVNH